MALGPKEKISDTNLSIRWHFLNGASQKIKITVCFLKKPLGGACAFGTRHGIQRKMQAFHILRTKQGKRKPWALLVFRGNVEPQNAKKISLDRTVACGVSVRRWWEKETPLRWVKKGKRWAR